MSAIEIATVVLGVLTGLLALWVLALILAAIVRSQGRYSVVRVNSGKSHGRTMSLWAAWEFANRLGNMGLGQHRVYDRWRNRWRDSVDVE